MGLNLSNHQLAAELDVAPGEAQQTPALAAGASVTTQLRAAVVVKKPVELSGEVESDEVYVVAGHTGYPAIVQKLGRKGRPRRPPGRCGCRTG